MAEGNLIRLPRSASIAALVMALALGAWVAACGSDDGDDAQSPAPRVETTGESGEESEAAERLGFPGFATKNTTRVGGGDSIATAAGAALAAYPSAGGVGRPEAVALVDTGSWETAIAAASLMTRELGAPILFTEDGEVPDATAEALASLRPEGSARLGRVQALRVGAAAEPDGLRSRRIGAEGSSPAELAAAVDATVARVAGRRSERVLVVSDADPGFAMPAAAWAALSGDPILFVSRDEVPRITLRALAERREARVYVLGPAAAVSQDVVRGLGRADGVERVRRVAGRTPVENAIAFARFAEGPFGWDLNDPGHGMVLASTERPLDAAAGAPLSARGKPGPLLLTDDAAQLPSQLERLLLDIRPGYRDDPTRAVYNHVWILGDVLAIGTGLQARIDDLAELVQITPEATVGPPERPQRPDDPDSDDDEATGEQDPGERGPSDTSDVPSDEEILDEIDEALGRSPRRGADR